MMFGTRAIRARSLTRRRFRWRGQPPRCPLDIPRRSSLEIIFTPCKTSRGSVDRTRRLARSTFRLGQLTGVILANLYSRRSQALAAGLLPLSGPLFPVQRSTCWMQQQARFATQCRFQKGSLR